MAPEGKLVTDGFNNELQTIKEEHSVFQKTKRKNTLKLKKTQCCLDFKPEKNILRQHDYPRVTLYKCKILTQILSIL